MKVNPDYTISVPKKITLFNQGHQVSKVNKSEYTAHAIYTIDITELCNPNDKHANTDAANKAVSELSTSPTTRVFTSQPSKWRHTSDTRYKSVHLPQ
jgi:hypothetical protein